VPKQQLNQRTSEMYVAQNVA